MNHEIECKWNGEMSFTGEVNEHEVVLDAKAEVGGKDRGPRPKPLILLSLAGCTGMDVVSLLKKMRVEISGLEMKVNGELTEEHPKHYKAIHLVYLFKGQNIDKAKVEKAVKLSQEKYCGVSHMVRQFAELSFMIMYDED